MEPGFWILGAGAKIEGINSICNTLTSWIGIYRIVDIDRTKSFVMIDDDCHFTISISVLFLLQHAHGDGSEVKPKKGLWDHRF